MNRKRTIKFILRVCMAVLLTPLYGQHQNRFFEVHSDSVFILVLQNNKSLLAAREAMESSRLTAGTGNTPPDPRVEIGYMFGDPSAIGNRVDFRVTQDFDFPTVYFQRAGIRDLRQEEAGLVYEMLRQEVLADARSLLIDQIFYNRMEQLYSRRLETAGRLSTHYRRMFESGEVGKLELSQANLQEVSLRTELETLHAEKQANLEALREMTGGETYVSVDTTFPRALLIKRDSLQKGWADSPGMRYVQQRTELKELEHRLAVGRNLPEFSAGYYSEAVMNESFRGVSLGLSVPLWSNKNKLKAAKADINVAHAEAERYRSELDKELSQLLVRRNSILQKISGLEAALAEIDERALMQTALEEGAFSLSEYVFATEYYFRNERKLDEYRRDFLLVENELMKKFY